MYNSTQHVSLIYPIVLDMSHLLSTWIACGFFDTFSPIGVFPYSYLLVSTLRQGNRHFCLWTYLRSEELPRLIYLVLGESIKGLNSTRMWCKTQVLLLQSQHATSSYYILKNRHNHTQSILIPIWKSNLIVSLLRCYYAW